MLEGTLDGAIDAEHEAARRARHADRAEGVAAVVRRLALEEGPRSFEHVEQLPERDRLGVAVEGVAAADAAVRLHEPSLLQRLEDLGDHRDRKVVEGRDLARGHDGAGPPCKVDGGEKSVVGKPRDLQHGRETVLNRYALINRHDLDAISFSMKRFEWHRSCDLKVIMKSAFAVLLVTAAAALGCHGRSGPAQRNQPQYDVVQEGQSDTATSTISAPGETQPPVTATNTDTTGSCALGTASPPANMPGGPVAGGVMQPQQPGSMASGMPQATPVQPPRTSSHAYVPPPTATTVVTTPPQPPPARTRDRKPPTETTDTTATTDTTDTATTDTVATDTTSTQKPPKKEKEKEEKTETSQPPPP